MRRRRLFRLAGAGLLAPLAGCSPCGETWTGIGFEVTPTHIAGDGDGWLVDATLLLRFAFGREGAGVEGAALATYDRTGRVAGTAPLGDLRWSAVPTARRESDECGTSGSLERRATIRAQAFPQWVGLRYDGVARTHTEKRVIAAHPTGTPDGTPVAADYHAISMRALEANLDETATESPVDHLTFDRGDPLCGPTPTLDLRVHGSAVTITHGRSVPAEHYRPVLLGYSYDRETLALDVGLRGCPRLQRLECRRMPYVIRTGFESARDRPNAVEIYHRDRDGDVTSSQRIPV